MTLTSNIKRFGKRVWTRLNPTYRKTAAIQMELREIQAQLSMLSNLAIKNQKLLWMTKKNDEVTLEESKALFWENFPKATGEMRILQCGNLFMMKALKKICDEIGVHFWLHGGTLIGGLRHQGFIPWDDDVDVGMTRHDLEKLKAACESDGEFELNVYYHDDHTFSRAYQFKRRDQRIPCFVDVFVFDFRRDTGDLEKKEIKNLIDTEHSAMIRDFMALSPRPRAEDIGCYRFGPFNAADRAKADEIIESHLKRLDICEKDGDYIYYSIENYPFQYPLMETEDIFPLQTIEFEGEEFEIPNNCEVFLKGYGDYMNIPSDFGTPRHFGYLSKGIDAICEFCEERGITI